MTFFMFTQLIFDFEKPFIYSNLKINSLIILEICEMVNLSVEEFNLYVFYNQSQSGTSFLNRKIHFAVFDIKFLSKSF